MSLRPATFAQLALVAIAALWGATFVMVQDAVHQMPVLTFLGYRFIAAALIVGVASGASCRPWAPRAGAPGWVWGRP
jgi:drug/metabolite transporter (DMT)-like permease